MRLRDWDNIMGVGRYDPIGNRDVGYLVLAHCSVLLLLLYGDHPLIVLGLS